MTRREFPESFLWGAATSSQQIEGAVDVDGRGESIWDRFARTPGNIADGSNSDVACDHYRLWREDVARMKWLGLRAYRFSISWPRVIPQGRGAINTAGLDFYDHLVDALLEAGITPFPTLYHWDLPQALQDEGGWAERSIVTDFVEYADAVTKRLGDRVKSWVTHNEPWCIAHLGHHDGAQAPGHRDPLESFAVAHHVLLSHGEALDVIRANVSEARVGIVLNLVPAEPQTTSREDADAVRHFDGSFNRWYLDPVLRGSYPMDAIVDRVHSRDLAIAHLPFVEEGDLAITSRPIDFLGLNYYSRAVIRADENGFPVGVPQGERRQRDDMDWEPHPQGLYDLLVRLHREYDVKELYVTENGTALTTPPDADGEVRDPRRIDYFRGHFAAAHRALQAGVPLKGYFTWSLLDNFEWAHGYPMRFGLFHVDYETLARTPKSSAHWYRDIIAANALDDDTSLASEASS